MLRDVRYAFRFLRFSPGFASIAILSLALGTGANTSLFQLLDAVRLRTLPVQAPQELVEIRIGNMTHARGEWLRDAALSNPLWEQIRDRQSAFSGAFAWADESFQMSTGGENRRIAGLWVSGDFFRVLGVQPTLGRLFTSADDRRGCGLTPGAVIGYGFWQREYGGDRSIVGRKVLIGKERLEVIGVTAPGFFGLEVGRTFDLALPLCSEAAWHGNNERLNSGTTWWLTVMGRLKPGLSKTQASAMLQASSTGIFEATLPADYPPASVKPYLSMKLFTIPAGHGISRLREEYSRPLVLLLGIAGLVLLIACATLANLMLARASAREREMAVRLAIGASATDLARQLLTEGLLLSLTGAGLGLLLARALSRFLVALLATEGDPTFVALPQDLRIFAFTAALAILTCLVFASAPVLRAIRTHPGGALKSSNRGMTSGRERMSLRRVLVALQIAVSLVLLMGALLFAHSLRNLRTIDPGFQMRGIVVADLGFPGMQLPPGRALSLRREVLRRLRAMPGVEAATEVTIVPLTGGNWNNRFWRDGSDLDHALIALRSMISTEYFRTLKTPLLAGREFTERDLESSSKVAIVNEKFARDLLGSTDAVGRRFWIEPTPFEPQASFEIVGVAKNAKYRDLRENFQPVVFTPLSQVALNRPAARFMIRSSSSPDTLIAGVRRILAGIDPGIRYSFHLFDKWIEDSLLRERLMATLSGLFAILALLLTAVGLYGVVSYTVARRTNEIGIRIALGAGRSEVMALILTEVAMVLAVGLAAGSALALAAGRTASTLLFELQAYDPPTLAAAAIFLALVAAAAGCLPAWRASSLNPVSALRQN